MSESNLYEAAVGSTAFGGLALGVFGFFYQLLNVLHKNLEEPSPERRAVFLDARIIACISMVPQGTLLSLPLIYLNPVDVPHAIAPAAIFVASMVFCTWVWLMLKVIKAGVSRRWFSVPNLMIFSGPAILPLIVILLSIFVLKR